MPSQSKTTIGCLTATALKAWLDDREEIALIDVREHGEYGEAHLFFAVNAPFSRLECEITRLVPRLSARVVVYDEDGATIAKRAAMHLARMGYSDVSVLEDGAKGWTAAGYRLFAGVNVPSKTFGELADHFFETPRIGARELAERIGRKDDLIVLDGRTFTEFKKMSIPGATSCPNGELALRVDDLVPSKSTTIVVNCAGRTRSIIGAQTLINLRLPNPVMALENGTQGWFLADLELEHGVQRRHDQAVNPADIEGRRARAQALADRFGVEVVDEKTARRWLSETHRTTFLCDVRTPEEFASGSLPGAQHTPGGQLIQATDQYVGVQRARLVLFDDEGIRARVVASWLTQMGWEAVVLKEGIAANVAAMPVAAIQPSQPAALSVEDLADELRQGGRQLVDIRSSTEFRAAHLAEARWSIRPRLDRLRLALDEPVILIASSPGVAALAAETLREQGVTDVRIHCGTPEEWRKAKLSTVSTPAEPPDADCIDFLFFVHNRHDGNKQAARQYLEWETNLVRQIDPQERARFVFR
ncbi:sulfurtransferase [Bradyrhizobium sp. ISRA443]|uniref:rhodanese-like domain-containing protein n=1 Tax=unclassified Bradyrhizobium TaxID=2631580 RepID=UPI0024786D9A|nr:MULTISPECIES: rhodanese-like domain-containing protein [unclassified Bradyrhizobium]WGR99249.1 sulfurtransferase [Bradyrhizobium sp. ISRA436]WGS06141.1 sulfurtransferase [Bradyrhizobium sp. ISRA437]WGS13026.1 sulfurtransferase [Bradyrhizobium sp. ISRA443]